MNKQFTFFFVLVFSLNIFSQSTFMKGYYIDNSDNKIEGFIKNKDWLNNPTKFKYKATLDSQEKILTIDSVKEFEILNISKYVRHDVDIDRSSKRINEMEFSRKPVFNNEKLFLKILIEGKASLYSYEDNGLVRYFFNKNLTEVKQLVSKHYLTYENESAVNNLFRQQLWNDLKCESIKKSSLKKINYKKSDLIQFFVKYNECSNSKIVNYQQKKKNKEVFNLTLRPGIRSSSVTLYSPNGNLIESGKNLTSFRLGLEAEFILGFNNNKWALLLEPTYHQFNSDIQTISIDQKSLEVNLGLRYYIYLKKKKVKFFVNASIFYDINFNSQLKLRSNNSFSPEVDNTLNIALGIGCRYKERFSLELRHLPSRNTLTNLSEESWYTDSQSLSIVLGYTIF